MDNKVDPLKYLDWDSQHFSKKIGQFTSANPQLEEVKEGLRFAAEEGFDCLYLSLPQDGLCSVESAVPLGFEPVGLRVEYQFFLKAGERWKSGGVRQFQTEDLAALEEIAARSHHDSRFYRDTRIPVVLADEMFRIWIRKSCMGWAKAVFVGEDSYGVTGYCSCHLNEAGEGRIGLVAVAQRSRGKGIGMSLLQESMKFFQDEDCRIVRVTTQGANEAARRLYERLGFEIESTSNWLHFWAEGGL